MSEAVTQSDQISEWARTQPEPGSFIDLGAGKGSRECVALLDLGWRGLFIDPAPDAAAYCAMNYAGRSATVLCAALHDQSRHIVPATWYPEHGQLTLDRYDAVAGALPIAVAAIHPSEMFEFWDRTAPVLPEPRFAVVDVGVGSVKLLELLNTWAPLAACRITVADNDEAQDAARYFSAAWKIVKTDGLSATAIRIDV